MALYTSQALMDAETRLLALSRQTDAPTINYAVAVEVASPLDEHGLRLGPDQVAAVVSICTSGRTLDILIGPAGTGKTTTLAAVRQAWETQHHTGSVVGLAPSATAAAVLANELGIPCENTARWLAEHDHLGREFAPGQLVIVDEASLAGTFTLDRISRLATEAGAKVLLVGDPAQLQAVDAGGAFALLAADRADAPELADVHRFHNQWEKTASLQLRHGHTDVIDAYLQHGRVTGGDLDHIVQAAYQAWHDDTQRGLSSILVADTTQTVRALNQQARNDLILCGKVTPDRGIALADGTHASTGDMVITRLNARRLIAGGTGWVRNGDRWTITKVSQDGSVTVRRAGHRHGASLVLPAAYAAENLDLGYAVTAHRAQGITVDTSHVVVTGATTRETLYVAMTRGRTSNHAWVATDQPDPLHSLPHPSDDPNTTARDVLASVLQRSGTEPSAHQAARAEAEVWGGQAQLCAEYETILAAGQQDRWAALIAHCGLDTAQTEQVLRSEAFGPLCAELRRAEANGHDTSRVLPKLVAARPLDDTIDVASVLHSRLARFIDTTPVPRHAAPVREQWIVGLVPEPSGTLPDGYTEPLAELKQAIEDRAEEVLQRAIQAREPWLDRMGPAPVNANARQLHRQALLAAAAYRDRYQITDQDPLGEPQSAIQRQNSARIRVLIERSLHAISPPTTPPPGRQDVTFSL